MCLQEDAYVRPLIRDVVIALSYLWVGPDNTVLASHIASPSSSSSQLIGSPSNSQNEIADAEQEKQAVDDREWGAILRNPRRSCSSA